MVIMDIAVLDLGVMATELEKVASAEAEHFP